jgi:mannose-6-phosphate isomerase-like protein (cupin superfamily)
MSNSYRTGDADTRPWGAWAVLDAGPGYCVKRITVTPGGVLSLQRHRHRAEHWLIVAGNARVTLGEDIVLLGPDQAVHIGIGTVHRVTNPGAEDLVLIEIQTGSDLREDDIERLGDDYGRV